METKSMKTRRNVLFGIILLSSLISLNLCNVWAQDSTTDDTTTTTTDSDNALPNGRAAIAYAREGSPGSQVRAAAHGEDPTPYTIYPVDTGEDYPDFWDRIKEIILDALMQFFTDITGISIPTT